MDAADYGKHISLLDRATSEPELAAFGPPAYVTGLRSMPRWQNLLALKAPVDGACIAPLA